MRVFFAAGGTAGHINPAIAISEIIKTKYPDARFIFAACPNSMEERILTTAGYEITYLNIHGLKRKLSLQNMRLLAEIPLAVQRAKSSIKAFAPDIVIGTGGYISYPVLRAAKALNIKTALHESNATPGLSAKLLAKKTDVVMVSMEAAITQFPKGISCCHVGTPLRNSFQMTNRFAARKKLGLPPAQPLILSFGGSLGAEALNNSCIQLMLDMASQANPPIWIHATGEKNYHRVIEYIQKTGRTPPRTCRILPYIHNMAEYMVAADVVICRSGASTLAELSYLGKPSLLVPYPYATQNHQFKNAQAMESIGGGFVIPEGEAMTEEMKSKLSRLLRDSNLRHLMGARAKDLQGYNTPQKILNALHI